MQAGTRLHDTSRKDRNLGFSENSPDFKMLAINSNLVQPLWEPRKPILGPPQAEGPAAGNFGVSGQPLSWPGLPSLRLPTTTPPALPGASLPAHS